MPVPTRRVTASRSPIPSTGRSCSPPTERISASRASPLAVPMRTPWSSVPVATCPDSREIPLGLESNIVLDSGPMTAEPADQRQRVLFVAGDLFAEHGFDDVTMADIAKAANVARAT